MKVRKWVAAIAATGSMALAMGAVSTTAQAAVLVDAGTDCALGDVSPNATACTGFWLMDANPNSPPNPSQNLLSGSALGLQAQEEALALLGLNIDLTSDSFAALDSVGPDSDSNYDFATLLNGISFIGIHAGGTGTAFYRIDADNIDSVKFNLRGGSTGILYATCFDGSCDGGGGGGGPIPEPGTWALMILGFGGAGAMLRRRRSAFA